MPSQSIPITLTEHAGIPRLREPVTIGLPFPQALVRDVSELSLVDSAAQPAPLQAAVLSRWLDGSLKWALLDFQVDLEPHASLDYAIAVGARAGSPFPHRGIIVEEDPGAIRVDTGAARFMAAGALIPKWISAPDGVNPPEATRCVLVDASGNEHRPRVTGISMETRGPLRTTIRLDGTVSAGENTACHIFASVSFFAGSPLMRLALTVRNPRPARHPNNFWDLGDPGSVYFRDLALEVRLAESGRRRVTWSPEPCAPFVTALNQDLEIYQDSSGGANWKSLNHVNRDNIATPSFCGYRVTCGGAQSTGRRAQPVVALFSGNQGIAGAVSGFWQNFPKAIETHDSSLIIRLFPRQFADLHELQGGEQKTHVVYLSSLDQAHDVSHLARVRAPLVPHAPPDWYSESGAVPYLTPIRTDPNSDYVRLVESAVHGDDSFESKREVIDEYGWRHFGDIYADHEAVYYAGPPPVISHYNNQYDAINGAFIQFLRSGDDRWFHMMDELTSHVIDIDLYHTTRDKPAFNGGPFWHTAHYAGASTATHRTYSRRAVRTGGGPGNEHCYTTGLMHHYLLTGSPASRAAVIDLAEWIIDIEDGRARILGWLDGNATGAASCTATRSYHGPGRGAANAITTLLNAFILSGERRFIATAEALIRRCIHPDDDIDARQLLDAERRWSYTVFLQMLGRYLDLKLERRECDTLYAYAHESLRRYARWMADHERPYLSRPAGLEYPTETWSAQDMRKSDVFKFAAKHARGAERERFLERSEYFFRSSVDELTAAKTRTLTRPVVLMMTCGYMHAYFQSHPAESAPLAPPGLEFGTPERFVPQRQRALAKLAGLGAVGAAAGLALAYWALP